ncbi:protein kinase [Myxococcus sp. K15C18031901]|uniref:protein kinase domain-containing protein n=1 Tax=Myxococcus dinghuensis TaxID=2906761 RepID=UPI0020A81598|nr:protein kinase [Myxococcus dinghuensis]MCP3103766.1 protein kinase [Myxococcus dinghuensis]
MNPRYRLVRPLASGGMAELFLGVARAAEGFERVVAIKRVLPHLAREPDIARMFLAEARLATHLQHQNIATVHDVAQGPEGLFLVMELVDGWDLGVLLRAATRQGHRFPPHLATFITLQTLAGLHHAYRKRVDGQPLLMAHRDVSPSNILVSREGEVKVTDFGIARLSGLSHTEPGLFKGKEAYTAPEVLEGAPATAQSDQFSLGLVFHELLTGRHPFASASPDAHAISLAILTQAPAPFPPDVPAPLATAVQRMLARAPEHRFPSTEWLAEVLARWLAQSGEPASTHTLAAFLESLGLPPTFKEVGDGEGDAPARAPAPPYGHEAAPGLAVDVDEPFDIPGTELSASGRLVQRCARCGTPRSGSNAPCAACGTVASGAVPHVARGARSQAQADTSPSASNGPQAPLPWNTERFAAFGPRETVPARAGAGLASPGGQALSDLPASPTLSLADSVAAMAAHSTAPSVSSAGADDLQLEERAPRPESDWDAPVSTRRPWGRYAVALLGVALAVGGSVWLWPHRHTVSGRLMASMDRPMAMAAPVLMLLSEPTGATVLVDGKSVGTTPLALDNLYPEGTVPVQVKLKGYRTWQGTFPGGQATRLEVKLQR